MECLSKLAVNMLLAKRSVSSGLKNSNVAILMWETKIVENNQVIPGDHLTDQDPPPVQTGFFPLGRLSIKVARNEWPPTSLSEAFLEEEDLGVKDLERMLGEK